MRPAVVMVMACALFGCRTRTGKILGPVTLGNAIAGNALLWPRTGEDSPSEARVLGGIGLITAATLGLAILAAVESRTARSTPSRGSVDVGAGSPASAGAILRAIANRILE